MHLRIQKIETGKETRKKKLPQMNDVPYVVCFINKDRVQRDEVIQVYFLECGVLCLIGP